MVPVVASPGPYLVRALSDWAALALAEAPKILVVVCPGSYLVGALFDWEVLALVEAPKILVVACRGPYLVGALSDWAEDLAAQKAWVPQSPVTHCFC